MTVPGAEYNAGGDLQDGNHLLELHHFRPKLADLQGEGSDTDKEYSWGVTLTKKTAREATSITISVRVVRAS